MTVIAWTNQSSYLVTDSRSFSAAVGLTIRDSFLLTDKMIKNELLSGVPLLILANKQDLPDVMGVREIKPVFQQAGALIGRRDCLTIPVSALTGEGVDEGIKWLVEAIKRHSLVRPPREND